MSPETILPLEAAVSRFLQSLADPTRILVAISGGSDSTGLLLALAEAVRHSSPKFTLCAATVDHGLRAGSADEARSVAALCQSLSIPHRTCLWIGDKPKTGIMAAAREARYDLLADAAAQSGADLVVTGHTLDDQRETLAMRGKRGGSAAGIADAMLFDRRLWVARPLLQTARADIRDSLLARQVGWLDDPSNDDHRYERVRTRADLASGPGDDLDLFSEKRRETADRAAAWLAAYFTLAAPDLGRIAHDGIDASDAAFIYALGRLAAVFGGQPFPLSPASLDRVLHFLAAGEPGRTTAGRVVFDRRSDGLYLGREDRGILPLSLSPGATAIWDGRYRISNGSGRIVRVEKVGSQGAEKGEIGTLPRSAARRALAVGPAVFPADDENVSGVFLDAVTVTPYFAPFDRFLTRFDFIFAERLTAAFGTRPYPRPPLGLIDGKTT